MALDGEDLTYDDIEEDDSASVSNSRPASREPAQQAQAQAKAASEEVTGAFLEELLESEEEEEQPQAEVSLQQGLHGQQPESSGQQDVAREQEADIEAMTKDPEERPQSLKSRQEQDEEEQLSPEEAAAQRKANRTPSKLNNKYLSLLMTGRLASKQKHENLRPKTTRPHSPGTLPPDDHKSVFDADMARLDASSRRNIEPISRSSRPASGTQSTYGASTTRSSPTSPDRTGPLALLSASLPAVTNPSKCYAPGPGAYSSPTLDRHGQVKAASFSFGTAVQRPVHVCIQDRVVSPGPVYKPLKSNVSTLVKVPAVTFPRGELGGRLSSVFKVPKNCPHWNPGPGQYDPAVRYTGASMEMGADAPRAVFGKGDKLITPSQNLAATVFVSEAHSRLENNATSPGPAAYFPDVSLTYTSPAACSLSWKASTMFDACADPRKQASPGPVYNPVARNYKGSQPWGGPPNAIFSKAKKSYEPEVSLSATAFISKDHSMKANQAVHSPGPIYYPEFSAHIPTPKLSGGQVDRFYDRLELGRVG